MNTSKNMFSSQVTGFARWQVFAMQSDSGLDMWGAAWFASTETLDKALCALRERAGKVAAFKGGKKSVLIINGAAGVGAWNIETDGKEFYSRVHGAQTVKGSLSILRDTYGAKNVTLGSVAQFEKMAQSVKVARNTELHVAKKTKAKKAKAEDKE